jgi:hypothetical protein
MMEKNGSTDAFRFFVHQATGGSDHICFNNASVAVPAIEFFTWPDQWYHADTDTPDKADPTEMKRVAFIGAATAWVSANLDDSMIPDLLDVVSDFGYNRVAERGIPRAMEALDEGVAAGSDSEAAVARAWAVLMAAVRREMDAVASIHDIHTGSEAATRMVDARHGELEGYALSMQSYLQGAAEARGMGGVQLPRPTQDEMQAMEVIPALAPGIRSLQTSLGRFPAMQEYQRANPGWMEESGLSRGQTTQIQNFVNGERSVTEIPYWVRGVTGEDLTLEQVQGYLGILERVGWVTLQGGD